MNAAQIQKLQNKVAKVVSKEFAEKEKQERIALDESMKEMMSSMKELEAKFPKRGPCYCTWDGWIWTLRKDTPTRLVKLSEFQEELSSMELVVTDSGMTGRELYYMLSEETFKENSEFMKWISEHYAEFKIALVKANKSEQPTDRLIGMSILGGLYQEMNQKFPKRTPMDLKEGLQAMDILLQQGIENEA